MLGVDVQLILTAAVEFAGKIIKNLEPTVIAMFGALVVIDISLSFLFDESDGVNIFMKLIKKVLYYSFFFYIIKEYKEIMFHTLFEGAVQLGNFAATGSTSSSLDFKILNKYGVEFGDIAGGILTAVGFAALDYSGLESATTVGLMFIAAYLIFFLMLYVHIVTTFIKFYFMSGFAYILMSFAGFDKTKDITLKALNGLLAQAIEVFVLIIMLNFLEYLDNYSFFKVTGGIKDTLWTRWALILFMYALLSKTGSIASSLMSGAIASFGIGANAMAGGVSRMSSAPGRLIGGDINKASYHNAQTKNGKENGNSFIYKAATAFKNGKNPSQ